MGFLRTAAFTARAIIAAAAIAGGIIIYQARFAPYIVETSPGGFILEFIQRYDELRRSGREVRVDGMCISACTLVTGLIPREHLCFTEFAQLAFHSATAGDRHSPEGTRLIWQIYPEPLRELLRSRGWDGGEPKVNRHPELIYVSGDDLRRLFRICN